MVRLEKIILPIMVLMLMGMFVTMYQAQGIEIHTEKGDCVAIVASPESIENCKNLIDWNTETNNNYTNSNTTLVP